MSHNKAPQPRSRQQQLLSVVESPSPEPKPQQVSSFHREREGSVAGPLLDLWGLSPPCQHIFFPLCPNTLFLKGQQSYGISAHPDNLFLFFLRRGCFCSSMTRDWTCAPCIGSTESQPLDHQGSPLITSFQCNYLFIHPSSKSSHTLRYQVLALQHVNLGRGDTIQPITSQNLKKENKSSRSLGGGTVKLQGQTLGDTWEKERKALKAESSC